jgi:hypothetical protein
MLITLTKEEFLKRYSERIELFKLKLEYKINIKSLTSLSESELNSYVGKLINRSIHSVINLVYDENF